MQGGDHRSREYPRGGDASGANGTGVYSERDRERDGERSGGSRQREDQRAGQHGDQPGETAGERSTTVARVEAATERDRESPENRLGATAEDHGAERCAKRRHRQRRRAAR